MTIEEELEFVKNDRDKIFQSLQISKLEIKKLKMEIGILNSELAEAKHNLEEEKKRMGKRICTRVCLCLCCDDQKSWK